MIGRSIGHFQITAKLGAGGMGDVYLASDTRLGRNVAIKVLPPAFTADAERLRRFEREAQLLALLSHPHIAAIYGMERLEPEGNGRASYALVLELVEGPTLADEVSRGPLPLDRALRVASQIAEALEYAHDRGIVHRDLKPANVKLSVDGQVKVLDFGLAKASDSTGASDIAASPTRTSSATEAGIILGTAAYMSPEQARGRPVDRRADIWAFGAVVYELLTGRRSYAGESVTELLAAVIRDEPDWAALPSDTPRRIRELLARCQVKDPRKRLQAIGEARIVLEEVIANPRSDAVSAIAPAAPARSRWLHLLPWAIAGILLGTTAMHWAPAARDSAVRRPMRLSVEVSRTATVVAGLGPAVVLSPDGTFIAFRGRIQDTEKPRIFIRRLDQTDAVPIPGTDDVSDIFFSPNGEWIGFVAPGAMKKVRVSGGDVETVTEIGANFRGGDWTPDGHIVYANNARTGISRISVDGGTVETVTTLDVAAGEITHRMPQYLAAANAILFTSHTNSVSYDDAKIMAKTLGSAGAPKLVLTGGYAARYVPTGHLLYLHQGTLFAVPFDASRLEVTGSAVRVVEGVANTVGSAGAQYHVSASGTLVYLSSIGTSNDVPIVWLDAAGKETQIRPPGNYLSPRVSPDGHRLALQIFDRGRSQIFIYDLDREVLSRLTSDTADEQFPLWSPDSKSIVFSSDRQAPGKTHLYLKRIDSTDAPLQLTKTDRGERDRPGGWSADGKTLVYAAQNDPAISEWDVMSVRLDGDQATGWEPQAERPVINGRRNENAPALSPDGRWLAYTSNETNRSEVYVCRYPELDGKKQISSSGGEHPTWSRVTSELMYTEANVRIMAVSYTVARGEFQPGKPRDWSTIARANLDGIRNFDAHPDGKRLVVLKAPATPLGTAHQNANFYLNFFDELRRIAK